MMILEIFGQFLLFIVFFFLSLVIFTFPGFAILKFFKSRSHLKIDDFILSSAVGICFFVLIAYILSFLNIRWLMWIWVGFGIISLIKNYHEFIYKIRISKFFLLIFLMVLLIGIIGQVSINAPSGFHYSDGLHFWSAQGRDGMWHIALMEQMHKNIFPFQNPEYAGHKLQNYHYFVDLLMSEITRLFPFSNLDVYFRFIPILLSLYLGLSGFAFVRFWSNSAKAGIWAMIFIYFAGSFGYFVTLARNGSLGGESVFWISQIQSVIGNPPQAAALILLICFLYFLLKYIQSNTKCYLFLSALLAGIIIEFKVYAGIVILISLALTGLYELIVKKKIKILILFLFSSIFSAILYLPNGANSEGFLIFQPWWFIRTMVVVPDRLGWIDMELKRQTYLSEGNIKRVIQLEVTAFLIFLIGNLGVRCLGFIEIFKRLINKESYKDIFWIFFFISCLVSFIIPLLFLQKGVAYNIIQTAQYFLLFFGFLSALSVERIFKRIGHYKLLFSIIIIILAIPTQIGLLWQFYSNPALSKITNNELEALNYLRSNSEEKDIILTAPYDKGAINKYGLIPPIFAWSDTGYVSALSGRPTLISDLEQISILGYDGNILSKEREEIFKSKDYKRVNDFLKENKIEYIYLVGDQSLMAEDMINASLVFQNKEARIYKVKL